MSYPSWCIRLAGVFVWLVRGGVLAIIAICSCRRWTTRGRVVAFSARNDAQYRGEIVKGPHASRSGADGAVIWKQSEQI